MSGGVRGETRGGEGVPGTGVEDGLVIGGVPVASMEGGEAEGGVRE